MVALDRGTPSFMSESFNYLYVDDDPVNRDVMETLLVEMIGVGSLVMFADSNAFIHRLKALDPAPDFILLDIHVEPHDGFEMLAMLRSEKEFDHVKVVAVTAGMLAHESENLQQAGFDGALSKPLDVALFPDLIGRLEMGEEVWQLN